MLGPTWAPHVIHAPFLFFLLSLPVSPLFVASPRAAFDGAGQLRASSGAARGDRRETGEEGAAHGVRRETGTWMRGGMESGTSAAAATVAAAA